MGLANKLLTIMSQVDVVDGDITISGRGSYKASSEKALVSLVRPLLIGSGLLFYPSKQVYADIQVIVSPEGKKAFLTTVGIEYTIEDAESGETRTIYGFGSGEDPSDKGAGKAMTYAGKYALKKLFNLVMDDEMDPDRHSSDDNVNKRMAYTPKTETHAIPTEDWKGPAAAAILAKYDSGDPTQIISALKDTLDFGLKLKKISEGDKSAYIAKLGTYEAMPVGDPVKGKGIKDMLAILKPIFRTWM